jgi:L-proline amide hydrolase
MDFRRLCRGPFGRTWYKVTADLHAPRTPLVILHGGPGCTHENVDSFNDLQPRGAQ